MQELSHWLRYTHSFAISYGPWTNGGTEIAHVRILFILRLATDELHLAQMDWKHTLPSVQTIIKMTRTIRNKNCTPNELFLGRTAYEEAGNDDTLIQTHLFEIQDESKSLRPATDLEKIVKQSLELAEYIKEEQEKVDLFVQTLRKRANERYNARFAKRVLQYNLSNWMLLSAVNTHRSRQDNELR
eukprot:snap_masked-scaffold_4-processed-gene-7.40-mRNA-1 protein AED:1.00 eAED:1.00 QI:0/-1/0/0/-1/1/1/0/185